MASIDKMREDWNRRAREDAFYYAAFNRRQQTEDEFLATASGITGTLELEFARLAQGSRSEWRALEIGCGPGRLMLPMSRHFSEIHGVDISEEMAAIARGRLENVPGARVHVNSGDSLAPLPDDYFDFVYSFAVFQHIPDRAVVLTYLQEARRVLKPGGVLCCQLRGAPPLSSELARQPVTWTGCHFSGREMADFARQHHFHLVAMSGLETQYLWTTWLKPGSSCGTGVRQNAVLKAVTSASSGERAVAARGPQAAVSLWLERMPECAHIGNIRADFSGASGLCCYVSPIRAGRCQINARLPEGVPPGPTPVSVRNEDGVIAGPAVIEVLPAPPRAPRLVAVSDGLDIDLKCRVLMGGMKVTIEDVARPEEVSFIVDGLPVRYEQFERKDLETSTYEFAFLLSPKVRLGKRTLEIQMSGRRFESVEVDIDGLSPERIGSQIPGEEKDHGQERESAEGACGAPLGAAVVGKRDLAGALAGWLHRKKT
jgi:SAM-dependent methyltransferase